MNKRYGRQMLSLSAATFLLLAACSGSEETEATDDTAANTTEEAAAPSTSTGETEEGGAVEGERPADWPTSITFGAVPSEQATSLAASYETTLEILTDELGVEIEFFQAADYAGIVEAQIAGTVDVAQYGPFSYIIAQNNGADIQPAGIMTDGPDVEPGYRSYGITQADNAEINSIEDFAGRQVCFVDPGSTSGYLYPSAGLLAVDIDPETGVTGTFAGGHDASAISVANGTCEAGFAFDSMVTNELIETGDLKGVIDTVEAENVNEAAADVKIVWKSPVIAGSPMAINNDLPASFIDAFIEVVTTKINVDYAVENGYCADAENCSFSDEQIWGYVIKEDSFFDGVRQVCEETKSPACIEG